MKRNVLVLAAAAVLLFVSGCASGARTQTVEFTPEPTFNVALTAGVGEGVDHLERQLPLAPSAPDPDARMLSVQAHVINLTLDAANDLIGEPDGLTAYSLSTRDAEQLARRAEDHSGADVRGMPTVTLVEGQSGAITIISETQYVSGYTVTSTREGLIGDPVTRMQQDGFSMELIGIGTGGSVMLEFDLLVTETTRMTTTTVELLGESVVIESPLRMAQRIQGSGTVDPTRVLALTGKSADGVLLVLIKAEVTDE
jgi:hypothetical protein